MWPQALQMTRDECRGILRRLELESYSQVISVFRAQGGLSDAKAKLLEELRGIFHISNERHRAEARRVANDEHLATIAEAVSGPNTWQEWSREGRRPYPMLPRVAPHTALALISNNVAEETASENAKLPYPAETGEAIREDQHQQQMDRQQRANEFIETNIYNVVTSDPFKVPKIPASTKKNLKRNMNEQQQPLSGGANKKRATSDNSPQKNNHNHAHKQNYPHITANSPQAGCGANSIMGASGLVERKQQQQQTTAQQQHLQKQRFFHHQQQLTKQKMAKKTAAAAACGNSINSNATNKRQATPAKSGRRANQKLLMEQKLALKKLQMADQQQPLSSVGPTHIDLTLQQQPIPASTVAGISAALTQQQLDLQFVSYAIQQNQPPQQIFMDEQQSLVAAVNNASHAHTLAQTAGNSPASPSVNIPPTLVTPLPATSSSSTPVPVTSQPPQIAVSKRDISKNLNKLQQMQQNQYQSNISPTPSSPSILPSAHDFPANVGTVMSSPSPSLVPVVKATEKNLISTTPVQKYIVEERQPVNVNIPTSVGTIVNMQNPLSSSNVNSIVQVSTSSNLQQPQIMTLPQFSAAATKLRAVNTTLIAPGTKMSPTTTTSSKKVSPETGAGPLHASINAGALHELANVASTQSQVLHIIEQQMPAGNNSANQSPTFNPPLHTPPAVIRIQSNQQGATTTASADVPVSSAQGSVLTTKILPLVLAGSSNQTICTTSSSVVVAGSSSVSTISTSMGGNIIKNLPSTVVLNTSTTNLTPVTVTGTIFSTLGAGATVFRKPPNIIKTTPVPGTCSSSKSITSSSSTMLSSTGAAPHIISNVKLTPVNVSSSTAGTPLCSTTTFKNVLPSCSGGLMRTSVKICQSPNGKVVIQSAGLVDGTKMKTMPHKIFANTPANSVTGSTSATGGGGGSGQRIAIQKVQIIPAPLGSPSGGANILQAGGNAKTSPLAGKSNMIFMPSSAASNVRPVTLSKMGNNLLLKSTAAVNAQLPSPSDSMAAKANIVVLSPSTPVKDSLNHQKVETNTSLLAEDNAPLDILNMPIVMEPGVGVVTSAGPEKVTVLSSSNVIESNISSSTTTPITILEQASTSSAGQPNSSQQTVILGATDWEMELDQAITTAAHNNSAHHMQQKQPSAHNKQKRTISSSSSSASNSSMSLNSLAPGGGNKQKRINSDLISIELKSKGGPSASSGNMNSLNNIIVVDSFDDVIVEEHEDEDHSQTSSTDAKNNEDLPKILDMQIYQQHDSVAGGGHKSKISIVGNQQQTQPTTLKKMAKSTQLMMQLSSSEAIHQHQQGQIIQLTPAEEQAPYQNASESEVDAGFDETIVTEIDENTAIEYIEEDGIVSIPNMTTGSTVPTTTTQTVVSNNIETVHVRAKESAETTVSNTGTGTNDGDTIGTTKQASYTTVKQSSNSGSNVNHSENYRKSSETILGSSSAQQQEKIASNSGTAPIEL